MSSANIQFQRWFSASGAPTGYTAVEGGNVWSFDVTVYGTGAVTAEGVLQISSTPEIDGSWSDLATVSLSGDGSDTAKSSFQCAWPCARFVLNSISGTNARVVATLSTQ